MIFEFKRARKGGLSKQTVLSPYIPDIKEWFEKWTDNTSYDWTKDDSGFELFIYDDLDISGKTVKTFPLGDFIKCKNLNISDTQITSLPKKMIVEGHFLAVNTPLEELPEEIIVYGNLYIISTKIAKLPKKLKVYGKVVK